VSERSLRVGEPLPPDEVLFGWEVGVFVRRVERLAREGGVVRSGDGGVVRLGGGLFAREVGLFGWEVGLFGWEVGLFVWRWGGWRGGVVCTESGEVDPGGSCRSTEGGVIGSGSGAIGS
jgi:hypothetical protein